LQKKADTIDIAEAKQDKLFL